MNDHKSLKDWKAYFDEVAKIKNERDALRARVETLEVQVEALRRENERLASSLLAPQPPEVNPLFADMAHSIDHERYFYIDDRGKP